MNASSARRRFYRVRTMERRVTSICPSIKPLLSNINIHSFHRAIYRPHRSTARLFTTSSSNPSATNEQNAISSKIGLHEPPLPIRIALVSTTTALATPSFPALGLLYAILRLTVSDADLRKVMEGRWGTLLSFTTWTVLPTLYHGSIATLILPCALSNAFVAGGLYGVIDLASGGPMGPTKKIYNTPLLGSGIGAAVGYLAPHYVYGPAMEVYGFEGMSQSISYVLNAPLATEVSVMTGAVAGMIMHPLLYYPIHGVSGLHWGYFSGLALTMSTLGMYYVYHGRESVGLPVPEGSFIDTRQLDFVNAVLRYNQSSRDFKPYSLQSGQFIGHEEKYVEGQQVAEAARLYSKNGNAIFDDRLLAFIYNYWDTKIKSEYHSHVIDVKSVDSMKKIQVSLAVTDAAVAILTERNSKSTKQNEVKLILDNIDVLHNVAKRRRNQITRVSLEETCVAIELLMSLKQTSDMNAKNSTNDLENFINNAHPNMILYQTQEMCPGVSVESQLRAAGWETPSLNVALDRWEELCRKKSHQRKKRIGFTVVAGSLLSILAATLMPRT